MSKLFKKIIALIMVIVLMGANLAVLGEFTIANALSNEELNEQTSKTNHKNVEFNSYFYGGTHNQTFDIGSEDAKLYLNVKVNNAGYLENGTVEFQNANFKLKDGIENENIQSIDSENNKIVLNKLNNGSDITIELPIEILNKDNVSLDYFAKEGTSKLTGNYVDGEGEANAIEKEIVNKLSWRGTAEAELKVETTKYVPYKINDTYGVMLQTKVNSGVKNGTLPIKNSSIELSVPEINGTKPSTVTATANKTEATNGKTDGLEFTNNNYSYDMEAGKVTLNVSNLQDSISWKKNAVDEYLVTYLFEGKEVYDYVMANGVDTNVTAVSNINVYNNEEINITKNTNLGIKYTEKLGTISDYEVQASKDISKGYVYANYEAKEKNETEYTTKYIATVNSSKLTTGLEFTQEYDKFVTAEEQEGYTTIDGKNYAYNKRVEISQAIFNKILGEDGEITVKDANGTELGKINKDTKLENGVYSLDIASKNNNKLIITTTVPVTEGKLEISVIKALKGEIDYSKEQMQNFNSIKVELKGKSDITTANEVAKIALKEPETKVELELNKKDLTTVLTNENVEIRAVLDTSSTYNALFKDSTLKITLPSYIENVNLKSANILLDNGLEVKSAKLSEENGHKVITVELEGNQTEYAINAEYKGAIVVLNTDLTTDTLTPSGSDKVTLQYTNKNETATKPNGTVSENVTFVAPNGVVAASGVSGYKEGAQDILSISDSPINVEVDTYSAKRTATISGTLINNYSNDISKVSVLGRIPAQGNKKIDTDEDLGSTFTMPLSAGITLADVDAANYKVYYSDNANAGSSLSDTNNGWSETARTSSKSFLIVFNDEYKISAGSKINFSYSVEIPENLVPNNNTYAMYKIYYTNNSEIGAMPENKVSSIIGFSTGTGPEAEITLSTATEVVREEQIVEMTATVKNTGDKALENAKLKVTAPEGTVHTEIEEGASAYTDSEERVKTISLGNIAAGQTVTVRYELRIEKGTVTTVTTNPDDGEVEIIEHKYPGDKEVQNVVSLVADNVTGELQSSPFTFTVLEGDLRIINAPDTYESETLRKGKIIRYNTTIENVSNDKDLSNVTLNLNFPEGIKVREVYYSDSKVTSNKITDGVTIDGNNVSVNVGELKSLRAFMNSDQGQNTGDEPVDINLRTKTYVYIEFEVEDFYGDLTTIMTAKADGINEQYSNVRRFHAEKVELSIEQAELEKQYIKEGTKYSYNFTIKNSGKIDSVTNKMEMTIPEGLSFIKATYTYNGETKTLGRASDGKFTITIPEMAAGTSATVEVTVKADMLPDKNDKEIKTVATLEAIGFDKITSNEVTAIIEYDPNANHGGGGDNPSAPDRYKIAGTAWIDEDLDGQRDSSEPTVANMQVILLNKDNSAIVKDPDTNEDKITTTSDNGTYQFDNLPNGEYVVVFVYDSSNYSLTEYHKEGVNDRFNSDAIDVNLTLNGERRIAGITDVLTIDGENVRNIDIGLYTANKFDLRLDKYVNKITLTTPTIGTRVDEYGRDTKVAKVEVLERNVGQSSAVIEYKIAVTNEGSVPGYVSKIVDYLPEKVNFSTELNPDWYLSENGNIYNASLANEVINPGETKEVTLLVSIRITEDLLDTLDNNAEIYESYNELGLQDIDSTAGNKVTSEDDMSKAEVVVSLVTGKIITYTAIILGVVALLGFGIYEIKKRVLDKKN